MCVRILNHHLSDTLEQPLAFEERLMFRLITNCLEKLMEMIEPSEAKTFEILLEIYKFFRSHPPEHLVAGVPSLKEI